MTLKIILDCDDIHPEIGYGLYSNDNIKYLQKLYDEFGIKTTLFVVPFWHGKKEYHLTQHKDWIKKLSDNPAFEIACHGLTHTNPNPELKAMEFAQMSDEDTKAVLHATKEIFTSCGIDVKGFRPPGWYFNLKHYGMLKQYFTHIAEHRVGTSLVEVTPGLISVPYTLSTEKLHSTHYNDLVIIHSHISEEGGNGNAWNEKNYNTFVEFYKKLIEGKEVEHLYMSELVNGTNK